MPTVNTHIRRIYEKPHVRLPSQAVAKCTHIPNVVITEYNRRRFLRWDFSANFLP